MSEDLTQKLPNSPSFEERVLAELSAIRGDIAKLDARVAGLDARLTTLEDKVDARLRETRPIWESVQQQLKEIVARLAAMEKTLDLVRTALGELNRDSLEARARIAILEERERERERLSAG